MFKIFLILLFIITASCNSLDDAKKVLTNQKIRTTDEFLVKKKEPLELPPEFNKIPEPDTLKENNKKVLSEEEKIKKILKTGEPNNENDKSYETTEKAILEKIRK